MKNLLNKTLQGQNKLESIFGNEGMEKIELKLYDELEPVEKLCSRVSIQLYNIGMTVANNEELVKYIISNFMEQIFGDCNSIEDKILASMLLNDLEKDLYMLFNPSSELCDKSISMSDEIKRMFSATDIDKVFTCNIYNTNRAERLITEYLYIKLSSNTFRDSMISPIMFSIINNAENGDIKDMDKFKIFINKIVMSAVHTLCDTYIYLYETEYL